MIVSYKWLTDFVDLTDVSPQEVAKKFISIGYEVEAIKDLSKGMERVKIGRIIKLARHPNAERLQICTIDIGNGEIVQILTAATNVFEGALVPCALDGADLPNGVKIKTTNMRGEESQGMLCSGEELCIDNSVYPNAIVDGIMILDESATEGQQIAEFLGLDDVVYDLKVLANRPDCQSVMGLAKELAVSLNKDFIEPKTNFVQHKVDENLKIDVVTPYCSIYFGCVVKNVKIKSSPKWLQNRLKIVGINPKNNIVDITNLVLWEMGQPLHAFDYDKIENHHIVVRNAVEGEKLICLNDEDYTLTSDMTVIADTVKPLGLAGIMGGKEFSICENTQNVVIESAVFDRVNIRRCARKLGLRSDASARYERGVQPISALIGLNRALSLIDELQVGEISQNIIQVGELTPNMRTLDFPLSEIKRTLGIEIDNDKIVDILQRLGISITQNGDSLICEIPSIRADIECTADLIEEIIRFYGYEHITPTYCENTASISGGMNSALRIEHKTIDYMLATGAHQVRTYGFRSPLELDKLLVNKESVLRDCIKIANPLSLDYSIMRTQMVGSMLDVIKLNFSRKNKEIQIFEIGKIFKNERDIKNNLPIENKVLAYATTQNIDFFAVKAITEMLASKYGLTFTYKPSTICFMHPNICADICIGNKKIGLVGKIHPRVTKNFEINHDCYYFEINLNELPATKSKKIKPLPKFPASYRDLAVVVDEKVLVGGMIEAIRKSGGDILESVEVFDVYQGEQVASGYKSVAFNLIFRRYDATLTQEEINEAFNKILSKLESLYQAKIRA